MSKEDVKKYFQMLVKDQEFVKKIADTGEDKKAKMEVIKSYGMEFTKEEFVEAAQECRQVCEENDINIEKIIQEVDDKSLENVAGGLLGGAILGGFLGLVGGEVVGFLGGASHGLRLGAGVGAGLGVCNNNLLSGLLIGTVAGGVVGGLVGAGTGATGGAVAGVALGALLPF